MKTIRMLTIAAAAAIVSTPAFAQVEVRISGASALQVSLEKAIAGGVCTAPGTKYVGSLGTTYVCNTAQGVATIRKRDSGGSAFGVINLNSPSNTLTFVSTAGCTGTPGAATVAGVAGWTLVSGCPATAALNVMYGVSDVEARLFASQGAVGNVVSTPLLAQVFGLAVNDKLYARLQTAQNTTGVPSLRSVDVRSLLIGNYRDWNQIEPTIAAIPGGTTAIKVCRRVATSGTQATFNALFLNNPCGAAVDGQLAPATNDTDDYTPNDGNTNAASTAKSDVYTVVMNSAAGNVDACLTAADNQNEMAIGLLGTERVPGAGGTGGDDPDGAVDRWKYVAIDGKQATVANAISGDYEYVAEATWNRNPAIVYTAAQEAIANLMITNMGSPDTIASEGLLGVAAIPDNGFDPTSQSPVMFGSRGGNTCRPFSNSF